MSEQKYTSGPWYAYPFTLKVADKKYWFDENGARHGDTPNMVIDCDSVADTHLIAAAPELLEALIDVLHAHSGDDDVEVICAAYKKAYEVIAKAKGASE